MTTAPRVEVFTQLACIAVHGSPMSYNHTISHTALHLTSNSGLDPAIFGDLSGTGSRFEYSTEQSTADGGDDDDDDDDPMHLPSQRCLTDPAVQAKAARLQTLMTTTMGALSAITTGWWGHFGERHGRTRVLAAASFSLMITYVLQVWSSHLFSLLIMPQRPHVPSGVCPSFAFLWPWP